MCASEPKYLVCCNEAMDLRPYRTEDAPACLTVFDSNLPDYFDPTERAGFEDFLRDPGQYFVIEHDGRVIGCGGIRAEAPEARLTWGMVHREFHRQGLALSAAVSRQGTGQGSGRDDGGPGHVAERGGVL